ncbi:MAG: FAD-dependent thymidylate synthase [Verrucomicrobia bacterium]|nr:FAD-dependent thymidylate synthase [Verrucomicrobiota bacterium]MBS0636712.1 FAD-dependent thymidylate synthase [Verrucomicrobiota bacterium]
MLEDYEEFTPSQIKLLERFVTNTKSSVFVLRNLPEVIKGALFSRYSRSSLGLRTLLLKEFISNSDETGFDQIAGSDTEDPNEQLIAIKKAQNFYDRILDGYGDDSIGELGGAHLAVENISMLAAKAIEDSRLGGSPLEKSTRYIYFDQKVKGEYLFYREPILMTSAYRSLYINTCNMLFDTYAKLIAPLTAFMEARFPKDPESSKTAYSAALRAKVLDCLRGLLPAATLTNMGFYGNGRFFEYLIHKMHCHNLAELQELAKHSYEELYKVIPSFIRRAEPGHKHHKTFQQFTEAMQSELKAFAEQTNANVQSNDEPGVRLISHDPDGVYKVAGALLYAHSNTSLEGLVDLAKKLSEEDLGRLLDAASVCRENRRQKSPRALEHATFTFEILADFGAYRDLHRHRILTQERQLLSCDYGYYLPQELIDSNLSGDYCAAMDAAKEAFDTISKELPEEAQYVVPMAYNIRWYFTVNLRALQWLCELRSSAAGHPSYRHIAQVMAREVARVEPQFERFFKFVDYEGYELGRLGQEQRTAQKLGLE